MPIEAIVKVNDQTVEMPSIPDGQFASMTNWDREDPHILLLWSTPIGGAMLRQEIGQAIVTPDNTARIVEGEGLKPVCDVPLNGSVEIPFTTRTGDIGSLVLRHVSG